MSENPSLKRTIVIETQKGLRITLKADVLREVIDWTFGK